MKERRNYRPAYKPKELYRSEACRSRGQGSHPHTPLPPPVSGAGQMRVDCNDPGGSPGATLPGNDFAVFPVNREELAGLMSRSER